MTSAKPPLRSGEAAEEPEGDEADEASIEDSGEEFDAAEDEDADELSEETGIDLSDASELDADNVTADEEFDRVRQAPARSDWPDHPTCEREADLERDLPVADLAVDHVAAGFGHFEPLDVAHR